MKIYTVVQTNTLLFALLLAGCGGQVSTASSSDNAAGFAGSSGAAAAGGSAGSSTGGTSDGGSSGTAGVGGVAGQGGTAGAAGTAGASGTAGGGGTGGAPYTGPFSRHFKLTNYCEPTDPNFRGFNGALAVDLDEVLFVSDGEAIYNCVDDLNGGMQTFTVFDKEFLRAHFGTESVNVQWMDIGVEGALYVYDQTTQQVLRMDKNKQALSVDPLPVPGFSVGLPSFNVIGEKKYIALGAENDFPNSALYRAEGTNVFLLNPSSQFPQVPFPCALQHLATHGESPFFFLAGCFNGAGVYLGSPAGSELKKILNDGGLYDENGFTLGAIGITRASGAGAIATTGTAMFYLDYDGNAHRLDMSPTMTQLSLDQGYDPTGGLYFWERLTATVGEVIYTIGGKGNVGGKAIYRIEPME